jgi:hypothetical protein
VSNKLTLVQALNLHFGCQSANALTLAVILSLKQQGHLLPTQQQFLQQEQQEIIPMQQQQLHLHRIKHQPQQELKL